MNTCRNCGHVVDDHGDRAVVGCATAVMAAHSPFRRVQCPCPGFATGVPESMPLPPLAAPEEPLIVTDPIGVSWYQYLREVVWSGRLGR